MRTGPEIVRRMVLTKSANGRPGSGPSQPGWKSNSAATTQAIRGITSDRLVKAKTAMTPAPCPHSGWRRRGLGYLLAMRYRPIIGALARGSSPVSSDCVRVVRLAATSEKGRPIGIAGGTTLHVSPDIFSGLERFSIGWRTQNRRRQHRHTSTTRQRVHAPRIFRKNALAGASCSYRACATES